MAESMIERVAKAIRDSDGCGLTVDGEHVFCDHQRAACREDVCGCRKAARAAVEAMREPTFAMLQEGHAGYGTDQQRFIGDAWRAMIDNILSESPSDGEGR